MNTPASLVQRVTARIRRPVLLVVGIGMLALAIGYLWMPAGFMLWHRVGIDKHTREQEARLLPIEGRVADVRLDEYCCTRRTRLPLLTIEVDIEATPPGASAPARATAIPQQRTLTRSGELPADLPRIGDLRRAWYDPLDATYLTTYEPGGTVATITWFIAILAGFALIVTVVAVLLVRASIVMKPGFDKRVNQR